MTLSAGGMTTDAARNGSLTIVVALPSNANASGASLCGKTCPTGANGSITACGHMYLDEGEDLELGAALDNYVTFTAETEGVSGWPSPACICRRPSSRAISTTSLKVWAAPSGTCKATVCSSHPCMCSLPKPMNMTRCNPLLPHACPCADWIVSMRHKHGQKPTGISSPQ